MDDFGERGIMLANMENLLYYNKEQAKAPDNQDSFGNVTGGDAPGDNPTACA